MNFKFSRIRRGDRIVTSSATYSADGRLIRAGIVIMPVAEGKRGEQKTLETCK